LSTTKDLPHVREVSGGTLTQGPEPGPQRPELSVPELVKGVRAGDRTVLGRAITLVESNAVGHQVMAQEMLLALLPYTGAAQRVGITGVPGVGKSTFIETLGTRLTAQGKRVAVLAVDPTSGVSGGSILGDKTRMVRLSVDPNAFIRPSPTSGSLGGVNRKTRETMLVCEAAGFDVVFVETVGVGQSETMVADMVDFFLVLMLAGAGDELQGIKRGILEFADMVAINKADGPNRTASEVARSEYAGAMRYLRPSSRYWTPPVMTCSGQTGAGLDELWAQIGAHRRALEQHGELLEKRKRQQVSWMWTMLEDQLRTALMRHPAVAQMIPELEAEVRDGKLPATLAAQRILQRFGVDPV